MTVEIKVLKSQWTKEKEPHVMAHNTEILTPQADFARDLIARWGMVSALDDGEDSSGRHKLKLMPPHEVVSRAIETSDLMYKAFADNNMLIQVPTLDEMQKIADKAEDVDKTEIMLDRLKAKKAKAKQEEETE